MGRATVAYYFLLVLSCHDRNTFNLDSVSSGILHLNLKNDIINVDKSVTSYRLVIRFTLDEIE